MKKKGILIYSILISMVFSFAIIYFVLALTIEYKTGNYRTERLFYTLCEDIENSADGFPAMDTIEKEGNFAAITIFKNRRCIFSYPSENAQNIESTKFIKVNKKTIQNGNRTLELTAAMYTLRPLKIFQYGKFSFNSGGCNDRYRHYPWLLCNGGCGRRRRPGRYCHALRLLPL